jgi:hypothetical protein
MPIRSHFDKRTKKKISKSLRSNIAVHPFVIVSILAALAIVIWAIMFFLARVV